MKGQTLLQMTGRGKDCSFLLFWPACQHPNTCRKRRSGAVTLNSHAVSLIVVKNRHNALVYAKGRNSCFMDKFGNDPAVVDSPLDVWGKDWGSGDLWGWQQWGFFCFRRLDVQYWGYHAAHTGTTLWASTWRSESPYVFQSKLLPAPHQQLYLTLGRAEQEIEILVSKRFIYVHVHH